MTNTGQLDGGNKDKITADVKATGHEALLPAPEHVLSTLERDGSRRWLYPKLAKGFWWYRRRILAYTLMCVFLLVPHIKIAGSPLFRIDLIQREFTFFGQTFYPTDTLLLALLILSAFISIVFITAVTGRAWCGWACPQTVYMEFLFRPIDRLFERTTGKGGKAKQPLSLPMKALRLGVYLLLSMVLAHTFLAYFVGPEKLSEWILHSSPISHPTAFIVMTVATLLMTFDFYYFREQTCLIVCPYGRFQSVMLDRQSMIVAYDYNRGEPRVKGKRQEGDGKGDCVDCHQCTVVCPTGIDIRNGLQMECINCTQCIDACDAVMNKIGLPTGLIRYSSQAALEKKAKHILRARTIIYPLILVVLISGFFVALKLTSGFTANVTRGKGTVFTAVPPSQIMNRFNLKLTNRTTVDQQYSLTVISPDSATVDVIEEEQLLVQPREHASVTINVLFPAGLTTGKGMADGLLRVTDQNGLSRDVSFKLLGPKG
jgi:cytochrome c oxidase accessory protein FixG